MLIEPGRQGGLQQRPRIATTQRLNVKRRKPPERVVDLACGEHERDLLRQQAASHERKRSRRRLVQPLRVINNSQQRALLGRLGQQAEDRQSNQERTRRRVGGTPSQSKRDAKRLVLRLREAPHKLKERGAQLLNRRERELHLRLDPGRPRDPKPPPSLDRVLKQRGLADARVAMHHQHAATTAAHTVHQPVEHLPLALPAEQPPS